MPYMVEAETSHKYYFHSKFHFLKILFHCKKDCFLDINTAPAILPIKLSNGDPLSLAMAHRVH